MRMLGFLATIVSDTPSLGVMNFSRSPRRSRGHLLLAPALVHGEAGAKSSQAADAAYEPEHAVHVATHVRNVYIKKQVIKMLGMSDQELASELSVARQWIERIRNL
jgi:hypothetical protein